MDSDDVNDIDDTVEAQQVVDIIEDTYYEMMSNVEWNHLKNPETLESLSDSDFPSTLKIPESVVSFENIIRYDVQKSTDTKVNYEKLSYKSPKDFTDEILLRDSSASNISAKTIKNSNTPIYILTDTAPSFWTSFDEEYITLDSYDSAVESTLKGSKSIVYAVTIPTFDATDKDYVPDCPIQMFPTLLSESKKACFFYLKQQQTPIDEKRSVRGLNRLKRKDYRAHERTRRSNFGRR